MPPTAPPTPRRGHRLPRPARAPARPVFLASLLALLPPLASGCVTETRAARFVFEGPDDLDTAFFDTGTFHSTKLLFELDPASDLPHGKDYRALVDRLNPGHEVTGEGEEFRVRVLPRIEGGREVYGIVGLPEVVYQFRQFSVGGFRYPAEPRAWLFVFKPRQGNLEITYHGQRLIVEARGYWTPSIWFRREYGKEAGKAWAAEDLWIGLSRIRIDTRQPGWQVDGAPYGPRAGGVLRIESATRFRDDR